LGYIFIKTIRTNDAIISDRFQKLCDIEKVAKKALLTSNVHNFDLLY